MKAVSAKRRKKMAEYRRARAVVEGRAGGLCELELEVCTGQLEQTHHRQPRSRGGADHEDNLVGLCAACHQWIHQHPTAATASGLLLSWHPDSMNEPEPEPELYRCTRCEAPMDGVARIISEQTPYPSHCPHCAALLTQAQHDVNTKRDPC